MRVKGVLVLAVLGLLGGLLVTALPSTPAGASHAFYDQADAQGSNDVPGQKDLTQLGFDFSHAAANEFHFRWQWDDVGSSGANTLDACGLIDTDGNGLAEYAECASTTGNPAVLSSVTVWACGNNYADRCVGFAPPTVAPAFSCSVGQVAGANPFTGDTDTRSTCWIQLDPFPPLTALINVCSYPSHPGSAPADCVLAPGSGVTIVKDAGSDTTTPFSFLLERDNGNDIGTFTIVGSGQSVFIPLANDDQTYRLTETVPSGWTQTAASCNNAAASSPSAFTMTTADTTVRCSFTNAQIRYADLSVTKHDDLDPAVPGALVTYTIDVANAGPDPATGVQVSDTLPAGLTAESATVPTGTCSIAANPVTCSLGTIASGATRTVTIAARVAAGLTGLPRTLTDSASATTTETDTVPGNNTDSEDTEVVAPITVGKAADVASVPESGGPVTFTFTTTNNGPLPVSLTALSDSVFGDLNGRGTCSVPRTVAAGATYTCTLTETIAGAPAAGHVDEVTATVTDGYAQVRTSTSPPVSVGFDDAPPAATVVKSADVTSVPETGGDATFTVAVTNDGDEALTLSALIDSAFGDLDGAGDCSAPQTIAPGATYDCSFTETVAGDAGGVHRDTATATVADDDGNDVDLDSNEVEIDFTGVDPELLVGKSADVATVPEDGGDVTFTVTLGNPGGEAVTVTSLSDSVFGDLDGLGDCAVPLVLAPAATASCTFTENIRGAPGTDHRDTVSAAAEDDDGIEVFAESEEVVIDFTDVASSLSVTKTPSPTSVPESGGDVLFAIAVENTSAVDTVTVTSVVDDVLGDLSAACSVPLPTDLAPGETLACSTSVRLAGDAGVDHENTVTAAGTDDDGVAVEGTDSASVAFDDVAPEATVVKSVDPGTAPESGGPVDFTVTVRNDGAEDLTLDALVDSDLGDLDGAGDCSLPQTIPVGTDWTCSFPADLAGQAGTSHLDTITATVTDDEDTSVDVGSNEAEVVFTDVVSSLAVVKTADVDEIAPGGEDVTFTAEVTNTSAADTVTVEGLVDDVFGAVSAGCAPGLPADLAPGDALTCTFTRFVNGPLGSTHTDVVTVSGTDDDGVPVEADDDLDLPISDGPSTLSVVKTADVVSVPETGGDVAYAVAVENTSALDIVTVDSVVDSVFGDVSDTCTPDLPVALNPGETVSCAFIEAIDGAAGDTHRDVATVEGTGDDGDPVATDSNEVEVTFTDVAPEASVVKSADAAAVPETGGAVEFTAVVTNDGDEPFALAALVDSDFGDLDGVGDCSVPQTIAAGDAYECSFTETLTGNAGGSHLDTVTAAVADDDGNEPSVESNEVEVAFTDVAPEASVVKSADAASVPETGGPVEFTATVTNDGAEPLAVSGLVDSDFGDLDGRGDCLLPQFVAPGDVYGCAFTETLAGNAGGSHLDTVTATVADDEGNEPSVESNEVEVAFTDVASVVSVVKSADVASVPETGGPVGFGVSVGNDGDEPLTLTALSDSDFGALSGRGDCVVPQTIPGGAVYACSFTETLAGNAGGSHLDTVTATVADDDGNEPSVESNEVEVAFTDVAPVVSVVKSADVASVPETGGAVEFTAMVANDGDEPFTLTALVDSAFGDLDGAGDCSVPQTIADGDAYACSFTETLAGDAGGSHLDTVTATVADDDGNEPSVESNEVEVTFTDVAPEVMVGKAASMPSVPEPGGPVTFTVLLANPGAEAVSVVGLVDDVFGDLDGAGDCALPVLLAPAETSTCSFTAVVAGDAGDVHRDTVTATVTDDDGNEVDGTSPEVEVALDDVAAELTATKTASVDEVPEDGAPVTFTVAVHNPSVADTVTVESVVDDVFGDVSGSCTPSLPADLAPGGDLSCAFTRDLRGDAGGGHVDIVTVSGTDDDGAAVQTDAEAQVAYTDVVPALEVTKTPGPATVVEPGGPVTFTVAVHNPSPVDTVTVTDVVDDVFGDVSAACGAPLTVGPDETVECEFTGDVTGDAGDVHENTVTVSGTDDDGSTVGGGGSAEVPVLDDDAAAITITKTPSTDEVAAPGGDVTFDLVLTNDSPTDVVTVGSLVDEAGATTLDLATACGLPVDLDPSESIDCSFDRTISGTGGEVDTDVVTASGHDDDGNAVTDTDSAEVTVRPVVGLVVIKDDGGSTIVPGRNFAYELRVANDGPSPAQAATTVVDDLPTGLELVSAAGNGWDCTASTVDRVECAHPGPLAAGAGYPPVQIIVTTAPGLTADVHNVATATNPDDPDGGNDGVTTPVVPIADLELAKTVRQALAAVGDVVDYDIRLHNEGPSTATGIVVTEDPGAGLRFVDASPDIGHFDAAHGTWSVPRLDPGETAVLHYRARVIAPTATGNSAFVSAAGQADPDSRADEASSSGEDDESAAGFGLVLAPVDPADDPPADDSPADDADREPLARTGAEVGGMVLLGLFLVLGGLVLTRRRGRLT